MKRKTLILGLPRGYLNLWNLLLYAHLLLISQGNIHLWQTDSCCSTLDSIWYIFAISQPPNSEPKSSTEVWRRRGRRRSIRTNQHIWCVYFAKWLFSLRIASETLFLLLNNCQWEHLGCFLLEFDYLLLLCNFQWLSKLPKFDPLFQWLITSKVLKIFEFCFHLHLLCFIVFDLV